MNGSVMRDANGSGKMEQETHGITTKDNDNQPQIQTQDNKLVSPKASVHRITKAKGWYTKPSYTATAWYEFTTIY
jgi:hypothetical protein